MVVKWIYFLYFFSFTSVHCFSSPPSSVQLTAKETLVKSLLEQLNVDAPKMIDKSKLRKDICDIEMISSRENSPSFPNLWDLLEGEWKLLYSNNAGPSSFPSSSSSSSSNNKLFKLEKVTQRFKRNRGYQGIKSLNELGYTCENVLYIKTPLSQSSSQVILSHSAYAVCNSSPASMAIELDNVGTSAFPGLNIDYRKIIGPSYLRKGIFDTTFCNENLRISRGSNGELRVFTRE